ncbi:MAG: type IV toxin-antitoxin system AbiEi family antitoxin domain-containing protein [Solirubrobacteraceae bacterium]
MVILTTRLPEYDGSCAMLQNELVVILTTNLQDIMPGALYSLLHEHAVEQHGYITTRNAEDLGVAAHRLHRMRSRGVLDGVSRGVFRFPDVPAGPLDQYVAATLWPLEVQGVLSHATALDLHELCDINPSRIDVTVPPGFRTIRTPPAVIRLHREAVPEDEITWHEGIPIVTVYRAIRGSIDQHVGWNLIEQAIDTGRRRGRLTPGHADELRALRHTAPKAATP